jgi:hypothetical protein
VEGKSDGATHDVVAIVDGCDDIGEHALHLVVAVLGEVQGALESCSLELVLAAEEAGVVEGCNVVEEAVDVVAGVARVERERARRGEAREDVVQVEDDSVMASFRRGLVHEELHAEVDVLFVNVGDGEARNDGRLRQGGVGDAGGDGGDEALHVLPTVLSV